VPTIVPVRPASPVEPATHVRLDLSELNESQFRQGPDGWHAVLSLRGVEHRIWFKEAPIIAAAYTVELPLDRDFEFRAGAGIRLWKTRLAGGGCKHRRRYLSRNRRSAVTRPTYFRAGMANARTAGSDHPLGQDRICFGAGRLPRFAKAASAKKISRLSGVSKMHPPIFAIPV